MTNCNETGRCFDERSPNLAEGLEPVKQWDNKALLPTQVDGPGAELRRFETAARRHRGSAAFGGGAVDESAAAVPVDTESALAGA